MKYNNMKKTKRVGNHTGVNFFISDFKLKSSEITRQQRQRKAANNASHQRYHNLFHDSRKSERQLSNKKPLIEQLKFASATSTDYFQTSKSVTKRSSSKYNENQKSRLERINNEMYNYIRGGKDVSVVTQEDKRKSPVQSRFIHRKLKTSSVNQSMKEKLEKTALEKFHQAAIGQPQVSNPGVSEKKAQALFKFLREARLRHEQRGKRYKFQNTQHQEDRNCQTGPGFFKHSQTSREMEHQERDPPAHPRKQQSESVPSSNKNIVFQEVIANRKQPPLPRDIKKPHHQEIHRQEFDRNSFKKSQESGSEVDFGQIESSQQSIKGNQKPMINKPQQVFPESKMKANNNVNKNIQNQNRFHDQQFVVEKQNEPRQIEKQRKQSDKIIRTLEPEKKKTQSNYQQLMQGSNDFLGHLPQVSTISPRKLKDNNPTNNKIQLKQQKQKLNINEHTVEKVLTTQFLQQENKRHQTQKINKKEKDEIKTKALGAPPNLMNKAPTPKANKIAYMPQYNDEDDQLDHVQIKGNKLTPVNKPTDTLKKKQPPNVPQELHPAPVKKEQKLDTANVPNVVDQGGEQSESEGDALDALIFYIERIEDIGQYRMKSRDVYSDKSIGKQLIEINKICSYYMAHQFLYLTKQLHSLLTAPSISKDYFEILSSDLQQLRTSGQINEDISTLQSNMQESKKLLQKCYKEAKDSLPNDERILLLDGGVNYQLKCCRMLIKQFKLIYGFYEQKRDSEMIQKRCCYLIEVFCVLKMFSGEQIKQIQEVDDIQNYDKHIKQYKALLLGK